MTRQKISIVTPCFNEEENLERCVERVRVVMETQLPQFDYEHILTDNASTDRSREILRELAASDPRVKVLVNSKNVGPFRNMAVGLRAATGDLVVPMIPADLQDPPEAIPDLVEALTEDRDVVYGVRRNRRERIAMRAARSSYYRLVRAAGGAASPPPHAGEFLIARRSVIDSVVPAMGSYPYIRGLVAQATERFGIIEYEWGVREHGKSRNSIPDLIDQALNGLLSTARAPIRVALFLGTFVAVAGMLYGLVSVVLFASGVVRADPGIPTLIVAVTFFGGIQMLFLGLIGEYVVSIQSEVRPSPQAVQVERINLD